MPNVSLSNSVRQNLTALQQTADMMSVSQARLASGKKVNSALDNATNFFTSESLNGRANDLQGLLDGISNATKALEAANNAITAITKLVESAQATVRSAQSTPSSAAAMVTQFNSIRDQITDLADDASFNGVNLLNSTTSMKVAFNELTGAAKNELTVAGVDLSATGLAITAATTLDDTEATAKLGLLTTALSTLRSTASSFGSNLSIIQARKDFTKSSITTLQSGADNLVNADTNQEAATLLALQTRQQLSQSALSMANQQDQSVLRLFS